MCTQDKTHTLWGQRMGFIKSYETISWVVVQIESIKTCATVFVYDLRINSDHVYREFCLCLCSMRAFCIA